MSDALADGMDMQFLYDAQRRLFAIGYQVGGPLTFTAHYDLLASEARLTSLVAIAKGDVPVDHWLALGRPYTSANGQVLLSWSGTMFEYLMPLLFTRSFRNSLLENACAAAVERQIEYARGAGRAVGNLGIRIQRSRFAQYLPISGVRRSIARLETGAGGRSGGRALCHGARFAGLPGGIDQNLKRLGRPVCMDAWGSTSRWTTRGRRNGKVARE